MLRDIRIPTYLNLLSIEICIIYESIVFEAFQISTIRETYAMNLAKHFVIYRNFYKLLEGSFTKHFVATLH